MNDFDPFSATNAIATFTVMFCWFVGGVICLMAWLGKKETPEK